jgi:hypothetical protein
VEPLGKNSSGERPNGCAARWPGDGNWELFRADGAMSLDVRLTLRTRDDALVHMTYGGHWITQIV